MKGFQGNGELCLSPNTTLEFDSGFASLSGLSSSILSSGLGLGYSTVSRFRFVLSGGSVVDCWRAD